MVEAEAMDPAQAFEASLLSRQKPMLEATARGDSAVQQFYRDAVVFVTGGSGFLGKQLIEKLFRATKISKVFVLLRAKKGKEQQQRLKLMLEDPVFDLVREQRPHFADSIVVVAGDVGELRLGLSDADWNMITEQVNIIFHMAATTRFDEKLRVATLVNVRGAREALLLGKACKKLKSFVHVSTAYSHACVSFINSEVQEDFYQSPVRPEALIRLAETVEESRLNDITPSLIKNWPNTYSFAKAVAEEIVRTLSDDLPLCIVRPAIVICAHREPSPGWVDMSNVYGASGIVLTPGLGLMHVVFTDDNTCIGLIPVDYVNNAIIAACWETAVNRADGETKPKIYTVTTSTRNPTLWAGLRATENFARRKYPTPAANGYSFYWQTNNHVIFWIYSWLLHFIPAYIIDGISLILGKKRRFLKLCTNIYNMSTALSYFTINHWLFVDKNTATLYENLSPVDREIFDFDVHKIDWVEYMTLWCIGLRKYIIKDGLKGTNYAIRKQFVFKMLTYILAPIYLYLLFKVLVLVLSVLSSVLRLFL